MKKVGSRLILPRTPLVRGCGAATRQYDVAIVGAGVMGSAIAFELSKMGYKTINVDKSAAAGFGSTSASCGIIRTMYSHIDSVTMSWESYHLWKQWADHIGGRDEDGPTTFHEVPYVLPRTETAAAFMKNGLIPHEKLGIPFRYMDNVQLKERFPWINTTTYGPPCPIHDDKFGEETGELDGALVIETGTGYVSDTVLASHNLQRAAEAEGGAFLFRKEVQEITKSGGRVSGLKLTDGTQIEAPVVINVAGPWSNYIQSLAFAGDAPPDDSKVKTRPMRVEVAYPPQPPELNLERDGCVLTDFDVGVYIRPAGGNRLCIGSIEPPCDPVDVMDSADTFEDSLGDAWERQVHRAALRIPTMPIPNTAQGVSHMYDKSDDFTPIYDKTSLPGYYTVIGTSGNQFKNTGVVGQVMAQLVHECENGLDHDKDPLQVSMKLTGNMLNMQTFSRLRTRLSTSDSVLG